MQNIFRSRFQNHYNFILCEDLLLKQSVLSIDQLIGLKSVILSHSSQLTTKSSLYLLPALVGLEAISGQKANQTKAKKSIATFQVRRGQTLGAHVRLQRASLFYFLDKLIYIGIPRWRILPESPSPSSRYELGVHQFLLFPECENHYEFFSPPLLKGCTLQITGTCKDSIELKLLLSGFQFLF